MYLFPSTRTDYLMMNEAYAPLADVHVRRAISYAIDRAAIVKSVLFGYGKPANSFMPPQVPFYDPKSPGHPVQHGEGEGRAREVEVPERLQRRDARRRRRAGRERDRPDPPAGAQEAGINVSSRRRHEHRVPARSRKRKYQLGFSYWTMDIADPDELVTFAVDPKAGGAQLVLHRLQQPDGDQALAPGAARDEPGEAAAQLYAKIQRIAAQDAFLGFLYYSPFRYAYTSKLHGFFVYPLGNYHLEDAWLDVAADARRTAT